MRRAAYAPFILAISPSARGFAFVLFEGPTTPFDWGIKDIRGNDKNAESLAAITKLIRDYRPSALVIEEADARESRRGDRIRTLLRTVAEMAEAEGITVVRYTRAQVRRTFGTEGARTKPEIAKAVAAQIPALATRLPPLRKIWMSEDRRQSLFDAAALGFTFFARAQRKV
jgi:Holliday junction resolvasome RuvABC endonuclease subunit